MTRIRTILVDDEPLAIRGLEVRLAEHADIEIVDACRNGREAIRSIRAHKPDLVFLDIQMPGFDGFGVLQGLMDIDLPMIVFVTAFDEHAVRAFDAQAIDYLLKPVEDARLAGALERVRERLGSRQALQERDRLRELLREVAPDAAGRAAETRDGVAAHAPARYERQLNIRDRGQIFRVEIDAIERIDAAGDYMCIHTGGQTLILRETMKHLEKRLDPRKFQRIHRSAIINLDCVQEVRPHTNGECFLKLASGAEVKVSRSYRDVVARFL